MDNLVGKDYESLKDEWEGKYKIIIPSYMESEKPKGQIIDQSPAPNQMIVESEQEVKVWVSKM